MMSDMEKILTGLGLAALHLKNLAQKGAKYSALHADADCCIEALELLKEKEAVEPLPQNSGGWLKTNTYWYCGYCHAKLSRRTSKFCPNCGRKAKWE